MPNIRTFSHLAATSLMTGVLFLSPVLAGLIQTTGSQFEAQASTPREVTMAPTAMVQPDSVAVVEDAQVPAPGGVEGDSTTSQEITAPKAAAPSAKRTLSKRVEHAPIERVANQEKLAQIEAAKKAKKKKKRTCADGSELIQKNSNGTFVVPREVIGGYTKDFQALNSLGWSSAHKGEDGKKDGMLLGGIRCGNDLHRAGLRSGDVVHTVNGHKVTGISSALLTYTKVRKDTLVRVNLTRKGAAKTIVYRIQG